MREQLAALVEKLRHAAVENDHAHAEFTMVFLSPLPLSLPGTNWTQMSPPPRADRTRISPDPAPAAS